MLSLPRPLVFLSPLPALSPAPPHPVSIRSTHLGFITTPSKQHAEPPQALGVPVPIPSTIPSPTPTPSVSDQLTLGLLLLPPNNMLSLPRPLVFLSPFSALSPAPPHPVSIRSTHLGFITTPSKQHAEPLQALGVPVPIPSTIPSPTPTPSVSDQLTLGLLLLPPNNMLSLLKPLVFLSPFPALSPAPPPPRQYQINSPWVYYYSLQTTC